MPTSMGRGDPGTPAPVRPRAIPLTGLDDDMSPLATSPASSTSAKKEKAVAKDKGL